MLHAHTELSVGPIHSLTLPVPVNFDILSRGRQKAEVLRSAETVCATESKAGISAENRNLKSIVSLMPACHNPQATVPCRYSTSFLDYL